MASKVALCNLALSYLGTKATIAAMDENSTEASVCSTHFDAVRDSLLAEFDWNFARRVEVMALRSETAPAGWSYVYSRPNKCARFRGIWIAPFSTGSQLPPVPWEAGSITDGVNDVAAIFTNQGTASCWYTRVIENTELFSVGFQLALTWRLAEAIALPITNKDSLREMTIKLGTFKAELGKVMDANEGIANVTERDSEFISARGS